MRKCLITEDGEARLGSSHPLHTDRINYLKSWAGAVPNDKGTGGGMKRQ